MNTYTVKKELTIEDIKKMFIKADKNHYSTQALEIIIDEMVESSEDGIIEIDVEEICGGWDEFTASEVIDYHGLDESDYLHEDGEIDDPCQLAWDTDSRLIMIHGEPKYLYRH